MLTKTDYKQIKNNLEQYKYNSLNYTEYEEISTYDIIQNDKDIILLYGYNNENKLNEYHWACNSIKVFKNSLDKKNINILITFVPKSWVNDVKLLGFEMYAVWNDYFLENIDLGRKYKNKTEYQEIQSNDYDSFSKLTLACKGQSRGFSGQTCEWVKAWAEGKQPALPSYAKNSTILIKKSRNQIIGGICLATYGHESESGAVLWIREIAVHPSYQKRGIGRKLMEEALEYGKSLGTKRAFLIADECNKNAIGLYESLGFKGHPEDAEIDMIHT